jgi:hypothetical protein
MVLPPGWRVVPESQELGSSQDLFELGSSVARVAAGTLTDPSHTAEDRVAINRARLTAAGTGCASDPAQDVPTTLGGERAIVWSHRCADTFNGHVHAVHDGMAFVVEVVGPLESETDAAAQLEALRAGFAFVDTAGLSPLPSSQPDLAAVDAQLQGTWATEWHPLQLELATVRADGLEPGDSGSGREWWDAVSAAVEANPELTVRLAMKFEDGRYTQYSAADGGPFEVAWIGRYLLRDPRTVEATGIPGGETFVFDFSLRDDVMTVDLLSNTDPGGMVPETAILETLPYVRLP